MPNRNAYLAVSLDDSTRRALVELQDALQENLAQDGHAFDRMDEHELHMTFIFLGESLRKLKAEALHSWHAHVVQALQNDGQGAESAGTMRLSGISAFPPGKRNLLVAQFEAPQSLRDLQSRIEETAISAGIIPRPKGDLGIWTPHVTLGKVRASKAVVEKAVSGAATHVWNLCGGEGHEHDVKEQQQLQEGLESAAPMSRVRDALLVAPASGLILRGEQPKQAWIDWEETLRF